MSEMKFPLFHSLLNSLAFFTINLSWVVYSIYVPIFLRNNLQPLLGNIQLLNTIVGIIMVLDNIAAIIIQPIIGNLSDRIWVRKLGRRMPFLIIGIPFAALFLGLIGTFEEMFVLLLVAICGFNISMAFYNAPAISLLPDFLPEEKMSYGNSILNAIGGLANIVGLLLSAYLYAINHQLAFWVMAIIMIVCLIILIIFVREKKEAHSSSLPKERTGLLFTIKKVMQEKNILLLLLLFVVFIHNAAYQIAQTFFSSYAEELLHFPADKSATILGIFVIFQIVLSLFGGILTKHVGVTNSLLLGALLFLGGFLPLSIISYLSPAFFGRIITLNNGLFGSWQFYFYLLAILIMAFGWLLLFMNLLLAIWNIAPQQNIGMFTAFYYVFWNLAAILSPLLAGGFFDLVGYLTGINGLQTLFLLISAIYLIALTILIVIQFKQNKVFYKNACDESFLEEQIVS